MSEEMQKMMINMKSPFTFINYLLVTLWHILQTIIDGVRTYTPIVYNAMWNFTEALYNNDSIHTPPDSPRKPLIDNTWCDINNKNIIKLEDKKEM
jgi:hypothetical protein